MFALVDCNNFYASCERVFNPKVWGKPVIVLSNNDGCVIARSQEAKDLGIKMAAPAFLMKDFLEENQVQIFSSNYVLYGDMSGGFMRFCAPLSCTWKITPLMNLFLTYLTSMTLTSKLTEER